MAEELAAAIEASIPQLKRDYPTLDEALDIAIQPGDKPVVLADASDNPGAGGLGDTTHILRRILERGITGAAFTSIVDPTGVAACEKAGVLFFTNCRVDDICIKNEDGSKNISETLLSTFR